MGIRAMSDRLSRKASAYSRPLAPKVACKGKLIASVGGRPPGVRFAAEVVVEDRPGADPAEAAMHELAEGLQAIGLYLGAARQALRNGGPQDSPALEVMERALGQWLRSQHAYRDLRTRLPLKECRPPE